MECLGQAAAKSSRKEPHAKQKSLVYLSEISRTGKEEENPSPGEADLGTRTPSSRTFGKSKGSSRAPYLRRSLLPLPPTFVTLRTANGIILRVAVFSLGTHTVSFLPVPEVRDQSSNPGRESFHQQSQEHLGKNQ